MKNLVWMLSVALVLPAGSARAGEKPVPADELPGGAAEKVVSVSSAAPAASIIVVTQALAIRETGPRETVERFGETYAFSPNVLVVRRDEPTRITFRNLQPDDMHDFLLVAPDSMQLVHLMLPPLRDVSHTFVFHEQGLFPFRCTMHLPVMSGQLLVLPPPPENAPEGR